MELVQQTVARSNPKAIAAMNARKAELGIRGGRPKSALGIKKRAAIRSEEEMVQAIKEKSGFIVDHLLINTEQGDTRAALGLLDRAFGKPKDTSLADGIAAAFSLVALATRARAIEQAPQLETIESPSIEEKNA